MRLKKIAFEETHSFSSFFIDYIQQKDVLKKFYSKFPVVANFAEQIKEKQQSFPAQNRIILTSTLQAQYQKISQHEAVKNNLKLLQYENTFTITTGHQLNLFTGPLYFIFKIVTVINACKELKKHYPHFNFVPVYWMASEDHDYDEIKYFRLYGKKYTWETDQQGAVGRFNPQTIKKLIDEVPGEISAFKNAYLNHNTLSDAVRYYVNELFGAEGLIVLDADDRNLKKLLSPVMRDDLFNHTTKQLVDTQNQQLESLGYHTQVFARDINFFYLDKNLRSRLEPKGDRFKVVDTAIEFSKEEIEKIIEQEPEKLSPNVVLRPLYQEIILPNLAYTGGPAELVYWLQFKGVFDHFNVPFPMLMPRNFGVVIESQIARKFEKTQLEYEHLFDEKNLLFNHWIIKNTLHDLSLGKHINTLNEVFHTIKDLTNKIDSTLNKYVEAQATRARNSVEKIEQKILRAEKRVHREKLAQLENVKDTLFPGGSPQERVDNFLNFYQKDPQFISRLLKLFEPFDYRFNLLFYDEG
jgi:bacillithiol biosynthesis cysteine-adding enzyme BshC